MRKRFTTTDNHRPSVPRKPMKKNSQKNFSKTPPAPSVALVAPSPGKISRRARRLVWFALLQ